MALFRNTKVDRDLEYENEFNPIGPGLTMKEAKKRLLQFGYNELSKKKGNSAVKIFLSQFKDFMTWVLIGATIISGYMGEQADAFTILVIVVMNAVLGFIQEYKTEKSLEALNKLAAPIAKVLRDHKLVLIGAKEIVVGDIILVEEGDKIPADGIIIKSDSLESDESILTGESGPVEKTEKKGKLMSQASKSATEQKNKVNTSNGNSNSSNLLFMGCTITHGRAYAKIIATGMDTEMGKIANMLQDITSGKTPLQHKLEGLGRILVIGCIIVCVIVTLTGILRGEDAYQMFLVGVSLAVAAIPEGLPAIVTVSLALGIQRMMKKNTLVRKLPAVETLGCTNVICSDKTGTLTQNKMTVKKVYVARELLEVTGDGYDSKGDFQLNNNKIKPKAVDFKYLLEGAVMCNNSSIQEGYDNESGKQHMGDPTEIALLIMANKMGVTRKSLYGKYRKIKEYPFDSDRKMMSVICDNNGKKIMFAKGALESILKKCSGVIQNGEVVKIDNTKMNTIESMNRRMAESALRVICMAYKDIKESNTSTDEENLVFVGLIGMIDPPRHEARDAILDCKIAGITPVMITGDHKHTATAIAKQLNMLDKDSLVITGEEMDKMNDREFEKVIKNIRVYARVSPSHKYRIVKALKKSGLVVAMTGDGVNDAPAIKEADIGVSMGLTGTDVTKEASAMILLDDNFATIVAAVREGRVIYDNIRKFIRYLLACNIGEVLTMFLATLLCIPIPLLPIQILLVNLATDGLPAMALSLELPEKDIMQKKPRKKNENIFSEGLWAKIVLRGILIGVCTVVAFSMSLVVFEGDKIVARTVALCTLVMSQLFHVFECRSERNSIFKTGLFTNKYLVYAVSSSLVMLLSVVYIPLLQVIFKTASLGFTHWGIILCFSGTISLISNLYWLKKN